MVVCPNIKCREKICAKDGERYGRCHCKGFKKCTCGIYFNFREENTGLCEQCFEKENFNSIITKDIKEKVKLLPWKLT